MSCPTRPEYSAAPPPTTHREWSPWAACRAFPECELCRPRLPATSGGREGAFNLLRRLQDTSLPDPAEAVEGPFLAEFSGGAGSMPSVQMTWSFRDEDEGGIYE